VSRTCGRASASTAARRAALKAGTVQLIGEEALSANSLEDTLRAALHARDLETRLEDAQVALERASRARADFFARIGHDLKTPLTSIIGYSEAISGEAFGPLGDARYRTYAEAVREAGAHLLALIENLIHYGGGDDGRAAAEAVPYARRDLNALAASATRMTGLMCRKRGHTLVKRFTDAPLWIDCQPAAITQAIVNLLTNAIKYTGEGGCIEVIVRRTARHAEVAIADSGIGMSRDDLTVALQPFGRVSLPPETAQEGTGLGLPIVREIMALHHGQLDVSSAPGQGTTAVLRLPLPEGEEERRQKE
jgi:two-component system cell cycle sensor histidine kinase PleC